MAVTVKEVDISDLRDARDRIIDTAFPVSFKGSQYKIEKVCATFKKGSKHGMPVLLIRPINGGKVLQVRPSEVEIGQ